MDADRAVRLATDALNQSSGTTSVIVTGPRGGGKTRACSLALAVLCEGEAGATVVPWDPMSTGMRLPSLAGLMGPDCSKAQRGIVFFVDDVDVAVLGTKGGGTAMAAALRSIPGAATRAASVKVLMTATCPRHGAAWDRAMAAVVGEAGLVLELAALSDDQVADVLRKRDTDGLLSAGAAAAAAHANGDVRAALTRLSMGCSATLAGPIDAQPLPAACLTAFSEPDDVRTAFQLAHLEVALAGTAAEGWPTTMRELAARKGGA